MDKFISSKLRQQTLGLIASLIVQFILGIIANLYVQFPDTTNETTLWHTAWMHVDTALHIILGIGLFIGSLTLFIRSFQTKNRFFTMISGLGFLAILIAGYGGATFVQSQNDAYSLIMALGFIIALASYIALLAVRNG